MRDMSKFSSEVVELIWERDNGQCQSCAKYLCFEDRGWGWSVQHRKARKMGGSKWDAQRGSAVNGLLLCGSATTGCHGYVEAHPHESAEMGWSVSRWRDPAHVPVWSEPRQKWVYLTEGGGVVEVPDGAIN